MSNGAVLCEISPRRFFPFFLTSNKVVWAGEEAAWFFSEDVRFQRAKRQLEIWMGP